MGEEYISTEYLIMHEDDVDWNKISQNPDRPLSLIEARLFRKKINWKKYILTHRNSLTADFLEVGSKYFTQTTYTLLSNLDTTPEEFILNHKAECDLIAFILNAKPSADFLLETLDYWKDVDTVKTILPTKIDLSQPEYEDIRLLYEVE